MLSPLFILGPFFLLFMTSPPAAALDNYDDGGYPDCRAVECGKLNISYPFWVYPNSLPGANPGTYCGYTDLNITCDNGNKPVFHTVTDSYNVDSIDLSTKTISLIDSDVVGNSCPRAKHNVTIRESPALNFTPEVVPVTFFFNCSSSTKNLNIQPDNLAGCLDKQAGLSYVFSPSKPTTPELYSELLKACKGGPVESRVLRADLEKKNTLGDAFGPAMNKGFDLTWKRFDDNSGDCKSCEDKGGRCGSKVGGDGMFNFQCFCPKGSNKCKGGLAVLIKITTSIGEPNHPGLGQRGDQV